MSCQLTGWGLFVETGITHWERLATDWIRGLKRGGIFYHERMTTDFESEMKRLAIVMGIPLDQKRFECEFAILIVLYLNIRRLFFNCCSQLNYYKKS